MFLLSELEMSDCSQVEVLKGLEIRRTLILLLNMAAQNCEQQARDKTSRTGRKEKLEIERMSHKENKDRKNNNMYY